MFNSWELDEARYPLIEKLMRNWIFFILISFLPTIAFAQFRIVFDGYPDSAKVFMKDKLQCYTPCEVEFKYKQFTDDQLNFEVIKPSFIPYQYAIEGKPYKFFFEEEFELSRDIPKYTFDEETPLIQFDKLVVNFPEGKIVGRYQNSEGEIEELKWEGSIKTGADIFQQRFYDLLTTAGFPNIAVEQGELFQDNSQSKRYSRFVIGLNILDYDVFLTDSKLNAKGIFRDFSYIAGRTDMLMEWQVLDKAKDEVVLTKTFHGVSNFNSSSSTNIKSGRSDAFEDGLIKLMKDSSFVQLIRGAKNETYIAKSAVTENAITIKRTAPLQDIENLSQLVKRANPACVTVITDRGHGSGAFISSDGLILTATHVIEGVNKIEIKMTSGISLSAKVIASNTSQDVAILKVEGSGYPALPLLEGNSPDLGSDVLTIGTPHDPELGQSIAKGIISGKRKSEDGTIYLQADISVSPGNSGGPLIDYSGNVVGVVQSKVIREGVEGIGFALPISKVIEVLGINYK